MPTSLAESQSIFQQLQDRAVRLNSPDPVFLTGTAGEDLIDPPNQGEFEELIGNGGDDMIYGRRGNDVISGDDVTSLPLLYGKRQKAKGRRQK